MIPRLCFCILVNCFAFSLLLPLIYLLLLYVNRLLYCHNTVICQQMLFLFEQLSCQNKAKIYSLSSLILKIIHFACIFINCHVIVQFVFSECRICTYSNRYALEKHLQRYVTINKPHRESGAILRKCKLRCTYIHIDLSKGILCARSVSYLKFS